MAARPTVPFVPLARWSNGEGLMPITLPPSLRSFKGAPDYGHPKLGDHEYLVWAEPIGERRAVAVIGFTVISGAALVAVFDVATGTIERSAHIPGHAAPPRVRDAYVWAQQVGIASAARAVKLLREQHAGPASGDGEAWLRRQLEGLGEP